MKNIVVVALLLISFATLITAHVALAFRLALRSSPRWRAVLALIVPPLAPIYGFREGFRKLSTLWLVAVVAYVVALLLAQ